MRSQELKGAQALDFDRIERILRRSVRKVCPADLRGEIDDIVQTSLTRIASRVQQSESPIDYGSAYLWKVANHAVIDEIRKRSRNREDRCSDLDEGAADTGDPERAAQSTRIVNGVRECLHEAPEDRRSALGLHLQGLSAAQIATALGWKQKRCENLIYRGLTALRACLRTKGLTP